MKPKGRPKKKRFIKNEPLIGQFSPRGKPGRPDEIDLTVDQYEAIRLSDLNGMGQIQASKLMGISRQTYGRILKEGHKRIADGIINGKIIRIQGGSVQVG